MKTFILYTCLVVALTACQRTVTLPPASPTPEMNTPMPATAASQAPMVKTRLTEIMLKNAAYHSPDWGDYQLSDGFFYRTPATAGESPQLYSTEMVMPTFGDVNADGFEDAVVILKTQNGGNGNNKELAVILDQDGKPANITTISLGFMIAVDAMQIKDGIITLNMRVSGPNDALCCPSQLETWTFRLEDNQVIRLP